MAAIFEERDEKHNINVIAREKEYREMGGTQKVYAKISSECARKLAKCELPALKTCYLLHNNSQKMLT